jgi:hypothetical protein
LKIEVFMGRRILLLVAVMAAAVMVAVCAFVGEQSVSEPAVAGEDLTYTLTATNGGPDEAPTSSSPTLSPETWISSR